MYNVPALIAGFEGFVGILQSNLPQIPQIGEPLILSDSGVYLQDKHPLVSLENIWYAAPDFSWTNWLGWVSMGVYSIGAQVGYSGKIYIATSAVTGVIPPDADTGNWAIYNPFQVWLQQKYNQAVKNLFAEVVKIKKLHHMAKSLLERQQLYRGGGSLNQVIISTHTFVGFEILVQQAEGLMVILDQAGIQTTETQSTLTFYLYHSTVDAALETSDTAITQVNTFNWVDLTNGTAANMIMMYLAQNTAGVYYFGYYQDDLTGQAISKQWNCSQQPCVGCTGVDVTMYNKWSRYVTMRNIQVPSSAFGEDRTLFDTSKIIYNTNTNWGLNLSITVRCDLTDFILYSKPLYADTFAMQLAREMLSAIASNSRINPTNNQIQTDARADLDIKFPGSWIRQYYDSIESLNLDMSGFSKACMPCDNTKKMKWRSV